jgi:hypothetical protein
MLFFEVFLFSEIKKKKAVRHRFFKYFNNKLLLKLPGKNQFIFLLAFISRIAITIVIKSFKII